MRRSLMALVLSATAFSAGAQLAPPDPDWKEVEAPPPPAFRLERLIPLDLPLGAIGECNQRRAKSPSALIAILIAGCVIPCAGECR